MYIPINTLPTSLADFCLSIDNKNSTSNPPPHSDTNYEKVPQANVIVGLKDKLGKSSADSTESGQNFKRICESHMSSETQSGSSVTKPASRICFMDSGGGEVKGMLSYGYSKDKSQNKGYKGFNTADDSGGVLSNYYLWQNFRNKYPSGDIETNFRLEQIAHLNLRSVGIF